MIRITLFTMVMAALVSCNNSQPKEIPQQEKTKWLAAGDSIAATMQRVLLQNVSAAMKKGGGAYAVDFCNLQASPLTDSVAQQLHATIYRLSDKNRNPQNAIQSTEDSLAWERIKTAKTAFIQQDKKGEIYYYKPIMLGMPACIKCHGSPADIDSSTLLAIQQKYPADKATGYKMGDLRGMWKIKMTEEP